MSFNFNFNANTSSAPAQSGGAFGTSAIPSQPASSTAFSGLNSMSAPQTTFTSNPASTSAFPSFGVSSAFPSAPSTTSFNLGGANTTPSFGAFGSMAASQPALTASTPAFGGATSTPAFSAFGSMAPTQPAPIASTPAFGGFSVASSAPSSTPASSAFGFSAPSSVGQSAFGTNLGPTGPLTMSAFGQSQFQQQQQQPPLIVPPSFPQQVPTTPESILRSVKEAWDPNSPQCQFKHYFYNVVDPADVGKYQPGPMDDLTLHDHAVKNNPDPTSFVPALAIGFLALQKRANAQEHHLLNMRIRLAEIAVTLDRLRARHAGDNVNAVTEAKRRLKVQSQRTLQIMVKLHTILNQGTPLGPTEANVRATIDATLSTLQSRGSYGLGTAGTEDAPLLIRAGALWKQLEQIPDRRNVDMIQSNNGSNSMAALSEEDSVNVTKVLTEMHTAIKHFVTVLQNDKQSLDTIERSLAADKDRFHPDTLALRSRII